ncbi:MAG TPA: hypothetical protein VIU11_03515 [Nakamurella sp.]
MTAGARDLTDPERVAAREAVKTAQTAGPGGVQPTFVSDLPGRGRYEDRLKRLVLALVELEYDYLARGKAVKRADDDLFGWAHIAVVANRAKRVTDAVFGQWSIGPALTPGVSIHDAWETKVEALKDVDVQDDAAVWRVTKLLTGNEQVRDLDREHGAIQSRGPEKAIVDRVRAAVVVAKRDKLLETHKAWPAFADAGVVKHPAVQAGRRRGEPPRDVGSVPDRRARVPAHAGALALPRLPGNARSAGRRLHPAGGGRRVLHPHGAGGGRLQRGAAGCGRG